MRGPLEEGRHDERNDESQEEAAYHSRNSLHGRAHHEARKFFRLLELRAAHALGLELVHRVLERDFGKPGIAVRKVRVVEDGDQYRPHYRGSASYIQRTP